MVYQKFISPHMLPSCRHIPTCSEYAVVAFKKKGVVKGFFLTCRRLFSCHPFAKSKIDEVV